MLLVVFACAAAARARRALHEIPRRMLAELPGAAMLVRIRDAFQKLGSRAPIFLREADPERIPRLVPKHFASFLPLPRTELLADLVTLARGRWAPRLEVLRDILDDLGRNSVAPRLALRRKQ